MKKSLLAGLIVIAIYGSCKKGDTGPAGTNGTNGINGTNGNANVQSFTFTNQAWTNSGYDVYLNVPAITQSVLDSGAVIVYFKNNGAANWQTTEPNYGAEIQLSTVTVYNTIGLTGGEDVKVVVIPKQ